MKPNVDYGQTISSGNMMTGEATIEMTPAMFQILSSQIYTDKVLAVLREALCNARDAQQDVGEARPIEVHLPSRLEPFFHIRDFGPGLSEKQVIGYNREVTQFNPESGEKEDVLIFEPGLYLRYGASTKTDSNEFIGGLGIGCKSPLAYSDSFIVEAYQEGVCKTYSVYKENGKPQVSKLTETMTTEPNGLMVKLAVKYGDNNEFADKTAKFLKFFGYPVEVKGARNGNSFETPTPILETKLYSTYNADWSQRSEVSVLMGGVVYGLTDQYKQKLSQIVNKDYMLMNFGIGELTVAASREGLSEDPQTVAAIEARIKTVTETFYEDIVTQVDVCDTEVAAFRLLKKYNLIGYKYSSGGGTSFKVKNAAEALVIRGGKTIEDFLDQFEGKYRAIQTNYDTRYDILELGGEKDLILLDVDKKTGYVKVARKLAASGHTVVLLEHTHEKPKLEAFFGKLEVKKVSVEYPIMFPKGQRDANTVRVASSGLRTHLGTEVSTLEKDQEGYYIPYIRNTCELQGLSKLGLNDDDFAVRKLLANLVEGGVFTDDEVYLSRRAGMPAIKKTKLKPLTADLIIDKIKAEVTQEDMDVVVQYQGEASSRIFDRKFDRLWDSIKARYPLHEKVGRGNIEFKGRVLLRKLPYRMAEKVIPEYETLINDVTEAYATEGALIRKENSLALSISTWSIDEAMVDEMIAFSQFKRDQSKNEKKGV
jgi:hypothetical protein